MILNETQKQEVADYVSGITRYIETYNEIYDHVLSALEQEEQKSFQIGLVSYIIDKDFGGAAKIQVEEQNSRIALYSSFSGTLKREMLNTFKFPAVINNIALLILGLIFYSGGAKSELLVPLAFIGSIVMMFTPIILMVYKTCIKERGQLKPSVSTYALQYTAIFGMNTAGCLFYLFAAREAIITLEVSTQIALMLGVYFILSIYLRAFLKIYSKSLRLKLY